MRAKKSNYSGTSMMEREAEGTAGISAPLTADRLPEKGIQPSLRTFCMCVKPYFAKFHILKD